MIGDLNRRIIFQEEIKASDGAGGYVSTWQNIENIPEVYASVIPLSSAEILHYRQLSHHVNYQIVIRYRDDIKNPMRIINDGKIYYIKTISDIQGRKKYLKILAEGEE